MFWTKSIYNGGCQTIIKVHGISAKKRYVHCKRQLSCV
eukprot:UN19221